MDKELYKKIIKAVESSSGSNVNPSESTRYGTAGGVYQITPGEVQTLPNRMKNSGLPVSPELQELSKKPNYDDITSSLNSDPNIDEKVGDSLAQLLLKRNQGDLLKAAYRHHMGTNATIPASTADMFSRTRDPEYLKKVLSAYVNSTPDEKILDNEKFAINRDPESAELMAKDNFERLQKLLSKK